MSESQNENHMSIAFPVEGNSGMNSGNLLEPTALVNLFAPPLAREGRGAAGGAN
jgi:hypothetical protein